MPKLKIMPEKMRAMVLSKLGPVESNPLKLTEIDRHEITKNKFKNLSLEQLIRLQELVEKKDYSNQKKASKSKKKLLNQINVEIYKRDDTAIWK